MRRTTAVAAVFTFAALGCAESPAAPVLRAAVASVSDASSAPIRFEALAPGDEIRVRLHAYGCFHDFVATLLFRAAATDRPAASVASTLQQRVVASDASPPVRSDTVIGRAGLASLDRQLEEYRHPAENMCTSQSDLEIELHRDGTLVRRERYHLGSCRWNDESLPTTFASLAWHR